MGCAEFVKWKSDSSWMTLTPWSKLETLALSLLRKILEPDSKKRIAVKDIIEHKWCRAKFSGMWHTIQSNFEVLINISPTRRWNHTSNVLLAQVQSSDSLLRNLKNSESTFVAGREDEYIFNDLE